MKTPFAMIKLHGDSAATFLQGQLTCDVLQLNQGRVQLAAYCNRQGRVVSSLFVYRDQAAYYLIIPNNNLELSLKAFNTYAPFSRVQLEVSTMAVPTALIAETYQLNPELDLYASCVAKGIAMISPETAEKFIPQALNYDQWPGAISFTKGCYIGQEIVARTQHLGKLKRHLYRVQSEALDLMPGSVVHNQADEVVGAVVNGFGELALVVVKDSVVSEPLFCNDKNPIKVLSENTPPL